MSRVTIDHVSVEFAGNASRTVLALDDVSLTIGEGEFVCVMGPSGCGKTTLLSLVAGLLHPSRGEVKIDQTSVTGPGRDRAVVFQDDAVFPWMTVEENIAFSPRVQGMAAGDRKRVVETCLRMVHLEEFRTAWPRQLSGGMRKRVDLARGYAADPAVLLLDEPFGSLDVITKARLQVELRQLWLSSPRTMLFVTHDPEEALFLGERIVLLSPRPGRIAEIISPPFGANRQADIKTSTEFVEMRRYLIDRMDRDDVHANRTEPEATADHDSNTGSNAARDGLEV